MHERGFDFHGRADLGQLTERYTQQIPVQHRAEWTGFGADELPWRLYHLLAV